MDERGGFGKVTRAYAWLAFAVCVGIAVCIALFAGLSGCSAARRLPGPDAGVVSAFTGGLVSRGEAVRVVFTESKDTGSPIPAGAFTLEPAAEGELSWENEWTLVFSPSVPFAASMSYRAVVNPALLGGTGRVFAFEFTTLPPFLAVRFDAVRFDGEGSAFISGCVEAERGVSLEDAVRVVRPVSGGLGNPEWRAENGLFFFSFAPVPQEKSGRRLEIGWDGGPVGSRERGSSTFVIPGREEGFEVLDIRQLERNTFEITFSSPLKRNQDLRGFITLTGGAGGSQAGGMGGMSSPAADGAIRFSREQNVARVFSGSGIAPGDVLSVRELEDARGRRLVRPVQYTASSRWELPAVRFAGSGNILPTSQGSSMVVEARNISGLIVEAFQIPGRNLVQFLQVNSISGTRELNRVGEPVWSRAFDFPWEEGHKNRWLRRGLDLSELARRFPGDMFHIRVTFRKRHVHYVCPNSHPDFSHLEFPGDELPPLGRSGEDGEPSYWDSYLPDKWDSDWYSYVDDPDHPAFYTFYGHNNKEVTAGRNVLVSDLGLIAKRAASGEWLVAASDLRTARPPQSVEFEFVNYQGRVLETVRASGNGMAMLRPQVSPSFIFARSEGSLAFLKLNEADAL
ncbi:MAG: alpha-2-macroglobulin, partial [Spirochaetales bacterium]|nr:alpha-2-macroglobulin [Spirochaetales bacterium]